MATPVTDLHARLRGAGLSEPQAEAIAAGFEAIDRRMGELERRMDRIDAHLGLIGVRLDRLDGRTRVIIGFQVGTVLLIAAPYFGYLFGLAAP